MTEEVPLAPGAVYGFRYWNLTSTGHLRSVTQQGPPWHGEENVASCVVVANQDEPKPPMVPVAPDPWKSLPAPYWKPPKVVTVPDFGSDDHPRRVPPLQGGSKMVNPLDVVRAAIEANAQAQYDLARAEYPDQIREYEKALQRHRERVADHVAPVEGCSCGFYIVKDISVAQGYGDGVRAVFGVVKGYGRTIPMHKGWKIQKARIVALAPAQAWSSYQHLIFRRDIFQELSDPEVSLDMVADNSLELIETVYPHAQRYSTMKQLIDDWGPTVAAS